MVQIIRVTNSLIVTPTHDAYLENGTYIGLTVGNYMIAYADNLVNILENISFRAIYYLGNSKTNFKIPASSNFFISSEYSPVCKCE